MRKLLIIPAIAFLTMASNSGFSQTAKKKTTMQTKKATSAKAIATTATEIAEGKALVAKSDCLACHKPDTKLVGPAYKNIAVKYPAIAENYDQLASKIIKGGSGVWGQVPMSPHSSLSMNDAKKMVKYILSIR